MHDATKNCCFLIPVHPKHYHYVYDIMNKSYDVPFVCYILFTNRGEYELFGLKYVFGEEEGKFRALFLEDLCALRDMWGEFDRARSWINVKKLLGVRHLYRTTEFASILVVDAEVTFIPQKEGVSHEALVKMSCDRACIIGTEHNGDAPIIQKINHNAMSVLPRDWYDRMCELTNSRRFLAWFTNIPIYERKYLGEFFEAVGEDFVRKLTYHSFDHVVYYLFLAYKGYVTLDRVDVGLECYPHIDKFVQISGKYPILWVTNRIYINDPEYFMRHPHTFIVFHLDRR